MAVGSPGPIDGRLHLRREEAAVRQLGELVVVAQVLDPSPVLLTLGYVAHERHEHPPRAPIEQPDARFDGERLTVAVPSCHLDRARPTPAQRLVDLGQRPDGARVVDQVAQREAGELGAQALVLTSRTRPSSW